MGNAHLFSLFAFHIQQLCRAVIGFLAEFNGIKNKVLMGYFNDAFCSTYKESKLKKMGFLVANPSGKDEYEKFGFISSRGTGTLDEVGVFIESEGTPYTEIDADAFVDAYKDSKNGDFNILQSVSQKGMSDDWKKCDNYATVSYKTKEGGAVDCPESEAEWHDTDPTSGNLLPKKWVEKEVEHKVYKCCGHCGGHIYPTTDMIQYMTYEGLAQIDGFKTIPYGETATSIIGDAATKAILAKIGLSDSEVKGLTDADQLLVAALRLREPLTAKEHSSLIRERYKNAVRGDDKEGEISTITFLEWRAHWNSEAKGWFSIFPSSPKSLINSIRRTALYTAAGIVDWAASKAKDLFNKLLVKTGLKDPSDIEPEDEDVGYVDEEGLTEDEYEFEGWFTPDGLGYSEAIDELYDFYGSFYDDGFQEAIETWEDFDVIFDENYVKLKDKTINIPPNYGN